MAEITMREALLQKKQIENSFVQANTKLILETGVEGILPTMKTASISVILAGEWIRLI